MNQVPYESSDARSPYHDLLPIGERLSSRPLLDDQLSCFEQVELKPLVAMRVPEHLNAGFSPTGLPFIGGLAPHEHMRLEDAPLDVLASLGPLMQRLSEAVKQVPGVARTHFARWGDGSEHLHLWALARPAGMMQGRGPMLAFWDEVLPPIPAGPMERHLHIVASAMADGGGEARA